MLTILLWTLSIIAVEGGAVSLAVWLWKKIDYVDTDAKESWLIVTWIFAMVVVIAVGIALVATVILGTTKLFSLYG